MPINPPDDQPKIDPRGPRRDNAGHFPGCYTNWFGCEATRCQDMLIAIRGVRR